MEDLTDLEFVNRVAIPSYGLSGGFRFLMEARPEALLKREVAEIFEDILAMKGLRLIDKKRFIEIHREIELLDEFAEELWDAASEEALYDLPNTKRIIQKAALEELDRRKE